MGALGDEELVTRYRQTGEIRFFDQLVERHVGKVRSMVYPMVLNHADADEVTQEVFLRVIRGLDRFKQRAQFSSWLHRITMNTAYSFLKARARRPVADDKKCLERSDSRADPVANIVANEMDARIHAALALLSPKLRSAMVLTAIQGLAIEDAARVEGCAKATIYWRVHQARKLLRREIERDAPGTGAA